MHTKAIADWFLGHQTTTNPTPTVTNMKLQKLVYLAESCFGSLYNTSLIDDSIQAWDHGPAVKRLYGIFKSSGSDPIPVPSETPDLPDDVVEVLESVWETFGSMTAWQLRKLTHEVGPYEDHYQKDARNIDIPLSEVHAAWPDFIEVGAATHHKVPSSVVRRMKQLAATAKVPETVAVDVDQLMADYHAFAPSR